MGSSTVTSNSSTIHITFSDVSAGTYTLRAIFNGAGNLNGSSGDLSITISEAVVVPPDENG